MNKATKILSLLGLIALSGAVPLKQSLAQSAVRARGGNGGNGEGTPLTCDCIVTPPGEGFPPGGSANLTSFGSGAAIMQAVHL